MYIYMYLIFFKFFSHLGYYTVLSRVPCSMYMSTPNFQFVLFEILNMEMGLLMVSHTQKNYLTK